MRYHSTILSLLNLNKCINISYSPKSKYLVEDFGFSFTEIYFGVNKNEFFKIEKDITHIELIDTLQLVNNSKSFQTKSYQLKLQNYINQSRRGLSTLIQSLKNVSNVPDIF
jgi:polysaccharide pyruvyl transferase WcaK-like protein